VPGSPSGKPPDRGYKEGGGPKERSLGSVGERGPVRRD